LAAPSHRDGRHDWCHSLDTTLSIWISTLQESELNKVQVITDLELHAMQVRPVESATDVGVGLRSVLLSQK
jgi:hypothetical protein